MIFEKPNKVTFAKSDLSKVSFRGSDITRIRIGDEIFWGGMDGGFTIIEEEKLKKGEKEQVSLEDVLPNTATNISRYCNQKK
jgi:hypothetical protein